jgi:hypothetical protein
MEANVISWKTHFYENNKLMVHTFSERVKVATDFRFGKSKKLLEGAAVDVVAFDDCRMTIHEYVDFLLGVAKCAEQLKKEVEHD